MPVRDNYFACLNARSSPTARFVYVPPGVRCPMELSTYFRINAENTGQFERTLIIADKGAYVSYLEGCTAPMRDENQLHAAVVELVALDDAEIKYSTVQNWYPGDAETARAASTTSSPSAPTAAASARRSPGPRSRPARRSPGNIRPASCAARARRRVLFDRRHQQPPAGRHRHQDDPPGREHPLADHLQGHFGGQVVEHLSRPGLGPPEGRGRAQLHPVRQPADRRALRRPHRALYRGAQRPVRRSSTRRRRRACRKTSCSTPCSAGLGRRRRWR